MASIPYVATATGDAAAAPSGAIPIELFGAGGGGAAVSWATLAGKPAVIASGATAAAALTSIGAAPLTAPTFTGVPAAPTAAVATNTTQLATTAFVRTSAGAAKTQIVALAAQAAAVGTTPEELLVELNATITKLNSVIAALKA